MLEKINLNEKNGIIFDMDGTLLESMHIWETVGIRYLATKGVNGQTNLWEYLKPLTTVGVAKYFQENYGIKDSVEQIVDAVNSIVYEDYEKNVGPKKGVIEFLDYLLENNVKMSVATATDKKCVMAALTNLDMLKYFVGVYCCNDYNTNKSVSKIYDVAAEAMNVEKENVIIFEDAVHAIETAYKAGYKICAVNDIYAKKDEEKIKQLSNWYINDFTEILNGGNIK